MAAQLWRFTLQEPLPSQPTSPPTSVTWWRFTTSSFAALNSRVASVTELSAKDDAPLEVIIRRFSEPVHDEGRLARSTEGGTRSFPLIEGRRADR